MVEPWRVHRANRMDDEGLFAIARARLTRSFAAAECHEYLPEDDC